MYTLENFYAEEIRDIFELKKTPLPEGSGKV